MATTYITFAGITGPLDPSATLTLPPGQPTGFGVAGSFGVEANASGAEREAAFLEGGGAAAGKPAASPFRLYLGDAPATNGLWQRVHSGASISTACLTFTRPATGEIATRWISSYILLSSVRVISMQSSYSDGETQAYLEVALDYAQIRLRQFATPAGGNLGAPVGTDFTWNYVTNAAS